MNRFFIHSPFVCFYEASHLVIDSFGIVVLKPLIQNYSVEMAYADDWYQTKA